MDHPYFDDIRTEVQQPPRKPLSARVADRVAERSTSARSDKTGLGGHSSQSKALPLLQENLDPSAFDAHHQDNRRSRQVCVDM